MRIVAAGRTAAVTIFATGMLLAACSSADARRIADLEARVGRLEATTATRTLSQPGPVGKSVVFNEFGFSLPVPEGTEVRSAGLSGAKASKDEGQLTAVAGGVTMALIWTKQTVAPKDAVQGALQALISAQPALAFRPLNEGTTQVDGRPAAFGAFGAYDNQQTLASVGVIGAWACNAGTFSMTVVGANRSAVESSYQGFTNGFRCP